jgi:hypothetical protein
MAFQQIVKSLRAPIVYSFFVFLLAISPFKSFSQTAYRQSGNSYIAISGTSTLNEWTMTSTEAKCQAYFEIAGNGAPSKLTSLSMSIRSESLKSGHPAMDKNAYSTLNTSARKNIQFELTSSTLVDDKLRCTGNLTVGAVTKQIELEALFKILPGGSLLVSGKKKLLMSDYNIEAPTFMFGTVTTANEITVSFNVNLVPVKK